MVVGSTMKLSEEVASVWKMLELFNLKEPLKNALEASLKKHQADGLVQGLVNFWGCNYQNAINSKGVVFSTPFFIA
jgi:hypothetical protein